MYERSNFENLIHEKKSMTQKELKQLRDLLYIFSGEVMGNHLEDVKHMKRLVEMNIYEETPVEKVMKKMESDVVLFR
jgi:hypothetical protein